MSAEKFLIRGAGEEWGKLTLQQAHRMLSRGDISPPIEYFSDRAKAWRPIAGIMFELEPDRLQDLRNSGFRRVEVAGSGDEDCEHCAALLDRSFAIEETPKLPPEKCSCIPWCRCMVIPVA